MEEWTHRIQGISMLDDVAEADANVLPQLPYVTVNDCFTTGVPLGPIGGEGVCVARLLNIAARAAAVDAVKTILASGLPPSIYAARVVSQLEEDTLADWLAGFGLEMLPPISP